MIVKVTSSNDLEKYAYAANLRVDKLAGFNDGVFFERSTNSSESVNLNSALYLLLKCTLYAITTNSTDSRT